MTVEPFLCLTSIALITYGVIGLIAEQREKHQNRRQLAAVRIPAQRPAYESEMTQ